MKIHLLSGFLGSGKTTVIRTAAGLMKNAGLKTGVITNDQGIRLVDGGFLDAAGIPGRQVMNGCFCCNYSDLDNQIGSLVANDGVDVIFAESVGSCTDIVATVFRPLRNFRSGADITLSVVCDAVLLKMLLLEKRILFGPEVEYIYWKQVEEASLLLLNKTDLLGEDDILEIKTVLREKFGGKEILSLTATESESVSRWLQTLGGNAGRPLYSPEVDYDIYATGEAMMGWLDMDIEVSSEPAGAPQAAASLVGLVQDRILDRKYPIGHIKWLIDDREKLSTTRSGIPQDFPALPPAGKTKLLLNARVQTLPGELAGIVQDSISLVAARSGAKIIATSHSAFQPGYPRPEHRMRT